MKAENRAADLNGQVAKGALSPHLRHQAARRADGGFPFVVVRREIVLGRGERDRIRADAKAEADRLRARGWTKQDFAKALGEFLDETRPRGGAA